MSTIENISLRPALEEDRHAFDRANTQTNAELLDSMTFERLGGIAIAVAQPFEGPTLDEVLENGDAPIVRFLPWGNSVSRDFNQTTQTQLLSDIAKRPIIAMSSPSIGSTLDLSRKDRNVIKQGDFSPVAREMLAGLDELTRGRLARLAIMGASQGASFGVATAAEALRRDQFEGIDGVLALGLPNVKERDRPELLKDFSRAGAAELYETLIRGGVPQLVTANHFSLQNSPRAAIRFSAATTAKMARHPMIGYALSGGMGKVDTMWQRDIPDILRNTPLSLVSEGQGAIMPTKDLLERVAELEANSESLGLDARMLGRLGLISVQDGNHTMADHLPTVAALMQRIA